MAYTGRKCKQLSEDKQMKNTIAMIAKGYAVVNGCAGAVLAALMSEI